MRSSKLFPALIIGLMAMIAIITGFMLRESGNPDSPDEIHVIINNSSDNRYVQFIAGMQQAAEEQNVKLTVVPTGSFLSLTEEKVVIDRSVAEGADGVILQLFSDREAAGMLENLSSQVGVELVDNGVLETMGNISGIVSPDHKAIGETLAKEVCELYPGSIAECSIGVLRGNPALSSMRLRSDGFESVLEENGGSIDWTLEQTSASRSMKEMLADQEPPDILVALDNASLETAGEYAESQDKDILVVGTGTSTKAIYYLDSGVVESIVAPEDFMMGYQSVTDLAEYIQRSRFMPQVRTIEHRIIHRDTLFAEENQGILFPIQR